jgi:prenyltransferase beta subunit
MKTPMNFFRRPAARRSAFPLFPSPCTQGEGEGSSPATFLRLATLFSLAAILISSVPFALAQNQPAPLAKQPSQVKGDEITDEQKDAVTKGLDWLSHAQSPDGSFGNGNGYDAPSAVTSLAGLAFMANGNLPGRGKYGDNVRKALAAMIARQQESGLFTTSQNQSEMYSHGFATLFVAEVYGMTGDDEVKEHLQKAVRLIERAQNEEGGWRYTPQPLDADVSVTICQVMALRAARDAGIKVEAKVVENAIEYVKSCQNPDGGFSYQASHQQGSGFARTAAGTAALYYAGAFEDQSVTRGLEYLNQYVPADGMEGPDAQGRFFYGQYYAVQAMYLAGGTYWSNWYPAIRDLLIKKQQPAGNWAGEVDDEYCTAMALIILQMPNRYLPVFNGKGPGS